MSTCAVVYRRGLAEPAGRYCPGRPGVDLAVPTLALDPGHYLLAVLQDMDGYGGETPFVQEDVSDWYSLVVDPTTPVNGEEIEPNDDLAHATFLRPNVPVRASIGWAHDVDHFCVDAAVTSPTRFRITTATDHEIEAVPLLGAVEAAAIALPAGTERTAAFASTSRCVQIRASIPRPPPSGRSDYEIEAEAAP
jgi:hypothetical protein